MSTSANKRAPAAMAAAAVSLLLALAIAAGSRTFLVPCVHEDGSFGSCHWAGNVMTGIGLVLAAMSALLFFLPESGARRAVWLCHLPAALLGFLTPGRIVALCRMQTMRCRMIMQPAMTLLCACVFLIAALGVLFDRDKRGSR